ncbi:MAG: hypothetical protein JO187_13965 [Acidobacteria bacterium]|nr:hypothetical protein [Acidobacteriota bacterium]
MNLKIATGLIALFMFASAAVFATPGDRDKDKDNGKMKTLTGCLQKGDGANEYKLLGSNGSTWELRSDKVEMAPHVGHTVRVTAEPSTVHAKAHEMKEDTKDEMKEHGMAKNSTEHGHLRVTNLEMVSESCTK